MDMTERSFILDKIEASDVDSLNPDNTETEARLKSIIVLLRRELLIALATADVTQDEMENRVRELEYELNEQREQRFELKKLLEAERLLGDYRSRMAELEFKVIQ